MPASLSFSHGYRHPPAICIPGCEGPLLIPLPKRLGQASGMAFPRLRDGSGGDRGEVRAGC